jgi:hypothetical protein
MSVDREDAAVNPVSPSFSASAASGRAFWRRLMKRFANAGIY